MDIVIVFAAFAKENNIWWFDNVSTSTTCNVHINGKDNEAFPSSQWTVTVHRIGHGWIYIFTLSNSLHATNM